MKLRERNRKITHAKVTYTYKTTKTKKRKTKPKKMRSIRTQLSNMKDVMYDHLYRNKHITQCKAKGYIKKLNEMSPFIKKSKDELQVSENLLFQMKQILVQETRNKDEARKYDYNRSQRMRSAGSSSSEYIDFAGLSILNGETNVYDSDATHCSQEVKVVYQGASYDKNEHNYTQQSSMHNKVICYATETNGVLMDDTINMEDETLYSQAAQQDEIYSKNLLDNYETQGEVVIEAAEENVCNQTSHQNLNETICSQANVMHKVIYYATETNGVLMDDTINMEDETLYSQAAQQDEIDSKNLLNNYETQGEVVIEAAEENVCNETTHQNLNETICSQANIMHKVIYYATETSGVLLDDTIYTGDETLCSQATRQDEIYSENLLENYEIQGEIVIEAAEEKICNGTTDPDPEETIVINNSEACNLTDAMQIMTLNEAVAPADFETAMYSPEEESSNIIEDSQINDTRKLQIRPIAQGFDDTYGWLERIREIRQPQSSEYFSNSILPPELWGNGDFNVPEHIFRDLDKWD